MELDRLILESLPVKPFKEEYITVFIVEGCGIKKLDCII